MSKYHCYLCASDEGILLDIFGDGGKAICGKIETCLSVKIHQSDAPSTKICHKCAYELDACSKFVEKYRHCRDGKESRVNSTKGHCSLCSEPGRKGYIFDFKDGSPVNSSLHKIHEIFNDSCFGDRRRNLSICLNCRYNLDVLFDLKCIYQSTPSKLKSLKEKGLQLSELPKTKTRVVSRNTTYISLPQLECIEVSDTDSSSTSSVMPLKRKRGRPCKSAVPAPTPAFRTCEQCKIRVANGLDMYKYHRTGLTVCKECWLTMDPEKVTFNKRKKLGLPSGDVGTRKCAIILKDVLSNPAKYENIYKVEKDEHGNATFIITDDGSESEEREPATRSRRSHDSATSVESIASKRTRLSKRVVSTKLPDLVDEPPSKVKPKKSDDERSSIWGNRSTSRRARNGLATSDTEAVVSRMRRGSSGLSAYSEPNAKAASDAETSRPQLRKRSLRPKVEKPVEPVQSPSKEAKLAAVTRPRRATKTATAELSKSDQTEQPIRRTRANSLTSHDASSLASRLGMRNAKSPPESRSPPAKIKRMKTKSLSPKNSGSELELENPYTCGVCRVEYRSKLVGLKHELTHAKQPEVKLQRVTVPKTIVEEEASAESLLIEEPEEQSHDVSSTSDHRHDETEAGDASIAPLTDKEAARDVVTDTNEDKENSEESKSLPETDEALAELDEQKHEDQEQNETRTVKEEDKTENKTDVPRDTEPEPTAEVKVLAESSAESARDDDTNGTLAITEFVKNNDDKKAKTSDKVAMVGDKETEISEKETKLSDEETKLSDEETKVSDKESEINGKESLQNERNTETNEKETEVNDNETELNDKETKINDNETEVSEKSEQVDDSEKLELMLSEDLAKDVEGTEPPEEPSEQVLDESTPTSADVNGVTAESIADTEVCQANETEKETVALDDNAKSAATDLCNPEENEDTEVVTSVTSPAPVKENEDKDVAKDSAHPDNETAKEEEVQAETGKTDAPVVCENDATNENEEPELIVSDVLTEVFDLATAEVQKRLEKEKPRDEKCTTPLSETLENISREICNSADMPSLEPLVDDQSSNNQS